MAKAPSPVLNHINPKRGIHRESEIYAAGISQTVGCGGPFWGVIWRRVFAFAQQYPDWYCRYLETLSEIIFEVADVAIWQRLGAACEHDKCRRPRLRLSDIFQAYAPPAYQRRWVSALNFGDPLIEPVTCLFECSRVEKRT